MKLFKVITLGILLLVLGGIGFVVLANPQVKTEMKTVELDLSKVL